MPTDGFPILASTRPAVDSELPSLVQGGRQYSLQREPQDVLPSPLVRVRGVTLALTAAHTP